MLVLTNAEEVDLPHPEFKWWYEAMIGKGATLRPLKLDVPILISTTNSLDEPLLIAASKAVYFRSRLFMPERAPRTIAEREEVALRVKKAVYAEDADVVALRSAVANMEAAIQYQESSHRREPIPEDVKLLVWARDGGACVRCGSQKDLHFDHIIPVSKGGGTSEANVQILCRTCNLRKSDNIAAG